MINATKNIMKRIATKKENLLVNRIFELDNRVFEISQILLQRTG